MFHGILQVLHDTFLPDHLLNLPLILHVEWIIVQLLDLPLSLKTLSPLTVLAFSENRREPRRVLYSSRQLWVLALKLLSQVRVSENL